MGEISAPAPITHEHKLDSFDCGVDSLNDWLKRRALKNEELGASRTYVVCQENEVIGYYSLATGSVMHKEAPGNIRRNMPEPIPVMILGRLAIDRKMQKSGVGKGLLKDAVIRTCAASQLVGIGALLVHAISDEAALFYERNGFVRSPIAPMTLMLSIKGVIKIVLG